MWRSLLLGVLVVLNVVAFFYKLSCFNGGFKSSPASSDIHADYQYFRDTFPTALGLPAYGNPDLTEAEHVQLEGAKLFQRYLFTSQFKQCQTAGSTVRVLSLPQEHRYGFFSQLQGIAHSLLEAVVNDHVLSWSKFQSFYIDQERCPARTFDCYFLPITSCDDSTAPILVLRREKMRNSCVFEYPRRRMHEQPFIPNNTSEWKDKLIMLREKSGIAALQRDELFSPHFFVREALRFITRPNAQMRALIQELMENEFKPSNAKWQPFTHANSRVSVHIRAGEDKKAHTGVLGTEYYTRLLDRIETTTTREMEILFSSDSREAHEEFAQYVTTATNKHGQFIAQSRFGDLTSLFHDSLQQKKKTTDLGMLLMAQCFIFATTDLFVGFVPSNVAQTVHLLMGALRHTSMVPVLDSGGSPMSACHHFTEYPLRIIRHPHLTA